MSSPLENPFRSLGRDADDAPPWVWKLGGMLAGILGATLVRVLVDRSRQRFGGRALAAAGRGGDNERESWSTALFWAGFVGVFGAVGRLLAQRFVARTWTRRAHLEPA